MKIKARFFKYGFSVQVFEGKHNLPGCIAVSLRDRSGKADITLSYMVGHHDDVQGVRWCLVTLRRRPNGFRKCYAVIGGANPQPMWWY